MLLKSVLLQTKKTGKVGNASMKGGKKLAAKAKEDPRARVRKTLGKGPKKEPRRTLMTPRIRRSPRRWTRSLMTHVS